MGKKTAADRAAKKHAKEKKRQKKVEKERSHKRDLAARAGEPEYIAWRPGAEGIEGLARRMKVSPRVAAATADALTHPGARADAEVCWLPSRVAALSDEALVAALADRGVVTDPASFAALAADHLGAEHLATAEWLVQLGPDHGPHDRDLVRQAAYELWTRWTPTLVSNEAIDDRLNAIAEDVGPHSVDALSELWRSLGDGALARLQRASVAELFAGLFADVLFELFEDAPVDLDLLGRAEPVVAEILAAWTEDPEGAGSLFAAHDRVLAELGRREEAIARIYTQAAAGHTERLLGAASLAVVDGSREELVRARDAILATTSEREGFTAAAPHELGLIEARLAELGEPG